MSIRAALLNSNSDKVSFQQVLWLYSRGGRTSGDVEFDKDGKKYVSMFNPNTDSKQRMVYLPSDDEIVQNLNNSLKIDFEIVDKMGV